MLNRTMAFRSSLLLRVVLCTRVPDTNSTVVHLVVCSIIFCVN